MLPSTKQHITSIDKGDLLIAEPFLKDPNFERAVVLICDKNESGHMGFIINRPMEDLKLEDVLEEVSSEKFSLFTGGPVEQNLLQFVHSASDQLSDGQEIRESYHWGGDFDQLKLLINVGNIREEEIRFFLGYAGWAPGQLKNELDSDSWIVCKRYPSDLLTMDPKHMWEMLLRSMGERFKMISNFPVDPRLN